MSGERLGDALGQLVIGNRAGAAGVLGAEAAAKAAPDGYTLVVGGDEIARKTYRLQLRAPKPRTEQSRA